MKLQGSPARGSFGVPNRRKQELLATDPASIEGTAGGRVDPDLATVTWEGSASEHVRACRPRFGRLKLGPSVEPTVIRIGDDSRQC